MVLNKNNILNQFKIKFEFLFKNLNRFSYPTMQMRLLALKKLPLRTNSSGFFKQPIFPFSSHPKPENQFENPQPIPPKQTWYQKFFGPQTNTVSPQFKKRWLIVLPCFLSNLCLGSPYAWSIVAGTPIFPQPPLTFFKANSFANTVSWHHLHWIGVWPKRPCPFR